MNKVVDRIIEDVRSHFNLGHNKAGLQEVLFFRPHSVRLTYTGYLKVRKIYTEHQFPVINFNNGDLIKLYRSSIYPYYIGGKTLSLFDGEDAFAIKLYGGLRGWLDTL